jgi:hypothetical protein
MTLTTLIVVNAMLAAAVVLGIVWLLGSAIRADRHAVVARSTSLRTMSERRTSDRAAA